MKFHRFPFVPFQTTVPELPATALRLVSCNMRGSDRNRVCIDSTVVSSALTFVVAPPEFPPFPSPAWTSLGDGFEASVHHPRLLIDDFTLPGDNGHSLAAGIIAGTACAVCDGSFFPEGSFGGAAWGLFSAVAADDPLLGFNWVPGMPSHQSPFRSELSGIDGVLTSLEIIVFFHDITSGTITIGIDCTGAMNWAKSDFPLRSFQPSFDILQDIRERLEMLPITVHWRWVEGHQDDNTPYHKLD